MLLGSCLGHRKYRYEDAAFAFGLELNLAVDQRKQRVVFAKTDIAARMPFGAALTRDDVAGEHGFAAENLQSGADRPSPGRCVKIRLLFCVPLLASETL